MGEMKAIQVTEELSKFIISLGEDPKKLMAFKRNPDAVIKEEKLSIEAKNMLDLRYQFEIGGKIAEEASCVVVVVVVVVVVAVPIPDMINVWKDWMQKMPEKI